jgi:hypothetical protein
MKIFKGNPNAVDELVCFQEAQLLPLFLLKLKKNPTFTPAKEKPTFNLPPESHQLSMTSQKVVKGDRHEDSTGAKAAEGGVPEERERLKTIEEQRKMIEGLKKKTEDQAKIIQEKDRQLEEMRKENERLRQQVLAMTK